MLSLLPVNFKPSFKVATLSPFTFKRGFLVASSPSTPAGPSAFLIVSGFAPSLPARPIEPSLLTDTSPAFKPSFVKATSSPTFTPSPFKMVSPAFTLSTLISLFNLTVTLSPSASVVMLSSPLIATVEPNCSTLVEPLSPVKVKPLLVTIS